MLRNPLSKLWQRLNLEQVNTNSPDSHGGFTPVVMPIWNIYTISLILTLLLALVLLEQPPRPTRFMIEVSNCRLEGCHDF